MPRKERGFSLVEITVVLAIVSVLMILIYSMIEETMRATMFNESHNDLAILSQKAVNALQTEVLQTRQAFEENADGIAYRTALRLPSQYPVWSDSFLPVLEPSVTMAADTAVRNTGNSVLLARQLPPLHITYDHDADGSTPEVELAADRYVFQYVYLTPLASPSFSGSGRTLDLVMTSSVSYADFFQLASLGAPAVSSIVPKLLAAGITRAWDPGQPVVSAFYDLSGALDGTFDAPVQNARIDLATARSLLPGLRGGRVSGRLNYSVAFQPAAPASPYPLRTPIRLFARTVAGRPGFPSGFEAKIAGPAGNRQVLLRVVLMSHYGTTSYESHHASVTTAARF